MPLAIPHSLSQGVNRTAGSQHGSASEALWIFNFFFKKSLTCFFCIGFFGFPALLNLYYRFPLELITSLINKWLIILNHYMNFLYKTEAKSDICHSTIVSRIVYFINECLLRLIISPLNIKKSSQVIYLIIWSYNIRFKPFKFRYFYILKKIQLIIKL